MDPEIIFTIPMLSTAVFRLPQSLSSILPNLTQDTAAYRWIADQAAPAGKEAA
jgi:hypothetical protein